MLTRRKNRVKKNGKKRYMSRKMRGGDVNIDDYTRKCEEAQNEIDNLQKEITTLTTRITTLNKDIDEAQKKIDILDHNKIIPTTTYETGKKKLKEKLKEFEEKYGTMVIDTILKSKLAELVKNDDAATKTNYYVVKKEYGMFNTIYAVEKEYNNTSTKLRTHDYFNKYYQVPILFDTIKQKYDEIIKSNVYDDNVKENVIINKAEFKYTKELIQYYTKIKDKLKNIIDDATSTATTPPPDNLQKYLTLINAIQVDGLTAPAKTNVKVIEQIDEKMYDKVYLTIDDKTEGDKTEDIAYIFYRLHDTELVKTFLEEWLKVLKEEKLKEKDRKEEEKEKGKAGEGEGAAEVEVEEEGKLLGGAKENQIENKLKELLSKIYTNGVRNIIQTDFNEISSNSALNDKIKAVTYTINNDVNVAIVNYKEIKSNKTKQQIIYKIITSKIEEESIKPQYTENMTRENALKILHVYDEKNSKEIKDKYKMTKDMWTDILNNVTEKDRKPLIYKIISKVNASYDTLYQDKETTIDINFYKSVFNNNPFPYKELINVTRTGEGVTPIIYGVEELFKLYEDELKFIKDNKDNKDNKSNNAVKPPLKQKKIEITHKRKNTEFPRIFDSST